MTDDEFMRRAIKEAANCNWTEEDLDTKPWVGTVIAIDENLVAANPRGKDDHAEKIALQTVLDLCAKVPEKMELLSKATVYTTLEPCIATVRSKEHDSCADRLISFHPAKVVIGILDPNQGVCGKGVLKLQEAGIEVSLFPHELAMQIRRLNDRFIRAQRSLGITITFPQPGETLPTGYHKTGGTFENPPGPDVIAMTYVNPIEASGFRGGWWPQGRVRVTSEPEKQWEATVHFGAALPHEVVIVKANDLGRELINFYENLKNVRAQVVQTVSNLYCRDPLHVRSNIASSFWPLPMTSLPKGLDLQASIKIEVTAPGT